MDRATNPSLIWAFFLKGSPNLSNHQTNHLLLRLLDLGYCLFMITNLQLHLYARFGRFQSNVTLSGLQETAKPKPDMVLHKA